MIDMDLESDIFKSRLQEDNKRLNKIVSNFKLRYKKNFSFFYDELIVEKFRKDYPEKVVEYKKAALKKEPWLKYQPQNFKQRVDKMIFPSVLEKREGVSRKGVGAHLVHLSYSENHDRRQDDYGDSQSINTDINYGTHYTLSDIAALHPRDINFEEKTQNGEIASVSLHCDPSIIDNPNAEDCLDRLKRPQDEIQSRNLGDEIEALYRDGKTIEEIADEFVRTGIAKSEIKKFTQKIDDFEITCMFFGLRGYATRTQEEIARIFKVTQPAMFKRINKIKLKLATLYRELDEEIGGNDKQFLSEDEYYLLPYEELEEDDD